MANKRNDRVRNTEKPDQKEAKGAYERLMKELDTDALKTEKAVEDYINEAFRGTIKSARKYPSLISAENTMTPDFLARRKQAMKAYIPIIRETFAQKYPEIDVVKEFLGMNTMLCRGYEDLEYSKALSIGAAIWILDELKRTGQIPRGIRCTPADPDKYYQIQLPDGFFDAAHENSVIQAMAYTIQKRNATPGRKRKQQDIIDDEYAFMQSIAPFRKVTEYVGCSPEGDLSADEEDAFYEALSNRERFDTVMSMISPVKIERAVKRYEKAVMDYLDLFYQTVEERCKSHHRLARDAMEDIDKLEETRAKETQLLKPMGPVMQIPQAVPFFQGKPGDPASWGKRDGTDPRMLINRIESRMDSLAKQDRNQFWYWLLIPFCYSTDRTSHDLAMENISKEHRDIMERLQIDNPFEMCFAFLYLLDSGSNLPWLYNVGYAVMNRAAQMLPWGYMEDAFGDDFDDPEEDEPEDEPEEDAEDESSHETNGDEQEAEYTSVEDWIYERIHNPEDTIEDERKLYDRIYTDAFDNEDLNKEDVPALPMSLAQVIYDQTSMVLPRNMYLSFGNRQRYERAGFTAGEAELLARMLQTDELIQYKTRDWRGLAAAEPEQPVDDEPEETDLALEEDTVQDDKEDQIKKLKAENERLKNAWYEVHRERNELKRSIEQSKEETEREHQELVDLRELVFYLQRGDVSEVQGTETCTEFPYETQKRMVVFGGHDTWLKAIKPMLPTVRFIDKDMKPNADLIRNADIVWIQPNALSHARYYNIMDVARLHKKQVHYFATASAEKCAKQLVAQDQKE